MISKDKMALPTSNKKAVLASLALILDSDFGASSEYSSAEAICVESLPLAKRVKLCSYSGQTLADIAEVQSFSLASIASNALTAVV